jgi:hypothetical protein
VLCIDNDHVCYRLANGVVRLSQCRVIIRLYNDSPLEWVDSSIIGYCCREPQTMLYSIFNGSVLGDLAISHLGSFIACPAADWSISKIDGLCFSRLINHDLAKVWRARLRRLPDDQPAGRPVLHVVDQR